MVTAKQPEAHGLITIHDGKATTRDGREFDLSVTPIRITPPSRIASSSSDPGRPTVRLGDVRLSLPSDESLYGLTTSPYVRKITEADHIEITTDSIKTTQRGIVQRVKPTVIYIRTGHVIRKRTIMRDTLILIKTKTPVVLPDGTSVKQPREDEAKADELKIGDEVAIGHTTYLTSWLEPIGDYLNIIGALGVGLGMFNLMLMHGTTIRKRQRNWSYSVVLFVAMFGMLFITTYRNAPMSAWGRQAYEVMFWYLWTPLSSTTFSLLAFYLASAAYRAFKIKTAEAAVMSISAMIVMMGQVPIGIWLTHKLPPRLAFLRLEHITAWIFIYAHTPAYRAVMMGATIGAIAAALRLWLNLERGAFFDREM